MKIVFGGTFDPVHCGHLIAAREVSELFGGTTVCLMPCYIPVHKNDARVSAYQRLEMLRLASDKDSALCVDDREIVRARPSYTIESLLEIQKEQCEDRAIILVLGTDAAKKLLSWKSIELFSDICHLLVMQRVGQEEELDYGLLGKLGFDKAESVSELNQKDSGLILEIASIAPGISSSEVREKLSKKESVRGLVSDAVYSFICDNGLYV